MTSFNKMLIGVAMFATIIYDPLLAQHDNGNMEINEKQKLAIFHTAIAQLKENYIFPERILSIQSGITNQFNDGKYAEFNTLFDFLGALNDDFESLGNDHHLNIFYGPQYVRKIKASEKTGTTEPAKVPAEFVQMVRYENFFLKKVERLDGNIGYFTFNKFEELQFSKEAITNAMNFLSNSSALILDLRENGGGSAETTLFLMSYFLPDSTKLGEFRKRMNNEVVELWTLKDPLIKKFPQDIPVYILVSKNTSSAAEAFAYGLQHLKRASIIGDQTHGEANPGMRFVINEDLYMMIPTAVNVNAITGTNWDGVGVTPDIKIKAPDAFAKAVVEICRLLSAQGVNNIYDWMIPEYEAQLYPQFATNVFINSILGFYSEDKKIIQEDGFLYFGSETNRRKMIYMGNQMFLVEGRKDYRIRFPQTFEDITFLEIVWNDGTVDKLLKTN